MGKLEEGLATLGVNVETIPLFLQYLSEIELFNPIYKLVKVKNRDELVVRHILDSLSILSLIKNFFGKSIADIGSGAGLPGIPLAIALADRHFTLVERNSRRAGFLRNTQAVLSLANVSIEERAAEDIQDLSFDIITFRALSPINRDLLKTLSVLLKPGGLIIAYKGRVEVANKELVLAGLSGECVPLSVPFLDEERTAVVLRGLSPLSKLK